MLKTIRLRFEFIPAITGAALIFAGYFWEPLIFGGLLMMLLSLYIEIDEVDK